MRNNFIVIEKTLKDVKLIFSNFLYNQFMSRIL